MIFLSNNLFELEGGVETMRSLNIPLHFQKLHHFIWRKLSKILHFLPYLDARDSVRPTTIFMEVDQANCSFRQLASDQFGEYRDRIQGLKFICRQFETLYNIHYCGRGNKNSSVNLTIYTTAGTK